MSISNKGEQELKPIIAVGEMAGFPSPITGRKITYVDWLRYKLDGYFQIYDFQSLFFQKSYFIESLLKQNPSVEEVYRLLQNSVDATKEQSSFTNLAVRNRLKERYPVSHAEESVHNLFKLRSGTVVLRSSLSNDISYKIQENVLSVLGPKGRKHAVSVIRERKDEIITEMIEDIVRTYHLIYALNPNACIIEVGIAIPKLFKLLGSNQNMKEINTCLCDFIDALKATLKQEDVAYITGTTVENNSLSSGQYKLASEIISTLTKKSPYRLEHLVSDEVKDLFQYRGLEGMMEQEENFAKTYGRLYLQTKDKMYSNLVHEHQLAASCYQKTIKKG